MFISLVVGYTQNLNSLKILNANPLVYGSATDGLETYASILNTASYDMNVSAKRKVIYAENGSTNFFCWDICYLAPVDSAQNPLIIGSGDTIHNFFGHYNGQGNAGIGIIEYCFFDLDFPSDSVCYTVQYFAGVSNVQDNNFTKPNISVRYTDQNAIEIFSNVYISDILVIDNKGSIVSNQHYKNQTALVSINMEMNNGLYFAIIKTKKGEYVKKFTVFNP